MPEKDFLILFIFSGAKNIVEHEKLVFGGFQKHEKLVFECISTVIHMERRGLWNVNVLVKYCHGIEKKIEQSL